VEYSGIVFNIRRAISVDHAKNKKIHQ